MDTLDGGRAAPRVSVLVPAYNAQAYVAQSVDSMLSQTFADFELIVVDDCSTDGTLAILDGYRDPRLRLIRSPRNLGVVGARNRAMDAARGEFVAPFDADDLSLPTRLAKQVAYLDAHPEAALVGTATSYLEHGNVRPGKRVPGAKPVLLRWMLQVGNPLGHGTLMLRSSAVRTLGRLLHEEYRYAEDFELYHRILGVGEIGYVDEPLVLYRRHPGAVSARHEAEMATQAERVLARAYAGWLGADAEAMAYAVSAVLSRPDVVPDRAALDRFGQALCRLLDAFWASHDAGPGDREAILRHAASLWWGAIRAAVRRGNMLALRVAAPSFARDRQGEFGVRDIVVSAASGMLPGKRLLRSVLHRRGRRSGPPPASGPERVFGVPVVPVAADPERPAALFVVVDAATDNEAAGPGLIERRQAVFDRYGLRPVYAVDQGIAADPDRVAALRAIHDRGGCEFAISWRPEFDKGQPGTSQDRADALGQAIWDMLRVRPRFCRAGQGGLDAGALAALMKRGVAVDFSVAAGRNRTLGGASVREASPGPMTTTDRRLLFVPVMPAMRQAARLRKGVGRGGRVFAAQGGDVARLDALCRVAFDGWGIVPGNPQDLLPAGERTVPPCVSRAVSGWA